MGAGSWGTTFAQVLCDAGTPTVLWARRAEVAKAINDSRENSFYLPGIALTNVLRATADEAEALDGVDLVVLAVPAQSLRENLAGWAPLLPPGALLVSLMKGIELGSCDRMSEVIGQVAGAPPDRIAAVSGPNLAARSRSASTPRPWSRAPTPMRRSSCSEPATPPTSAPTPIPTWSAASWAAR